MDTLTRKTRADLGWDLLLNQLAARCHSDRGAQLCRDLAPLPSADEAHARQAEVSEARALQDRGEPLPFGGVRDLREALGVVHLTDWLAGLPGGLDERLERDAATISGGERQRLALARALLGGHRAVVLDELPAKVAVQPVEGIPHPPEVRADLVGHRDDVTPALGCPIGIERGHTLGLHAPDFVGDSAELRVEGAQSRSRIRVGVCGQLQDQIGRAHV